MKKLLCIIALALALSLTLVLVSCGEDEPTIEISEDGYVVVNGVATDIVADKSDIVTVDANGYVVVNGVKTEHKIHTTDEISVNADGYVVVNGVATEIVADKEDVITVDADGYVVVNGVKTEHRASTYDKNHTHILSDWGNSTATCEEDGTETRNCTVDGCYYTEARASNALSHMFDEDDEMCIVCGLPYLQGVNGLGFRFDGAVYQFRGSSDVENLVIPGSINGYQVIVEEPKAFRSNTKSITFMEGIVTVPCMDYALELRTVNLPKSVRWIEMWGRYIRTDKIENINVHPENPVYASVDGILYSKDKTTLLQYPCGKKETHFIILESVTHIGEDAFLDCDSLTDIYYCGTEEQWNQIEISYGNGCLTSATIHYNYIPE